MEAGHFGETLLQVMNYADGQGEDSMASVPDVSVPTGDKEDVLGAHSSFKDHRAESEASLARA